MVPFETKTIDLGEGKKLLVEELPPEVQGLVKVHDEWRGELRAAQLDVSKVQYALDRISAEISAKVEDFVNPKQEPAVDDANGEVSAESSDV